MGILCESTTTAVLLNRYLAYCRQTFFDQREKHNHEVVDEKVWYQVQWKNIKSDFKSLFKSPFSIAPAIAYSLLAFWFIFQGKHLDAYFTAFPIGAIAFDAASNSTTNGEVTSITYSHTIGSGSERYVIWDVQGFGQVLSSTFDGNAATVVINKSDDQKVWGYTAPGTGAKDIVVSTGGGGSIMASVSVSFTGVDQTTPTGATNYSENGNPLSISLTTTTANAMRVDFGGAINDSASDISGTLDAGTFRAQKQNAHNQFRIYTVVYTNPQAVAGADSNDWSFTNAGFYQFAYAVEIIASTGGGGGATVQKLPALGVG